MGVNQGSGGARIGGCRRLRRVFGGGRGWKGEAETYASSVSASAALISAMGFSWVVSVSVSMSNGVDGAIGELGGWEDGVP